MENKLLAFLTLGLILEAIFFVQLFYPGYPDSELSNQYLTFESYYWYNE